jgi:hypothetical protein
VVRRRLRVAVPEAVCRVIPVRQHLPLRPRHLMLARVHLRRRSVM